MTSRENDSPSGRWIESIPVEAYVRPKAVSALIMPCREFPTFSIVIEGIGKVRISEEPEEFIKRLSKGK